jgi:hypothetical protein
MVYSHRDRRNVAGYRQSNQTILIPIGKLSDSDMQIIEDKYGHRYARNTPDLDQFAPGYQVFTII